MRGESLGEILTLARKKKFWTLAEAAEKVGVSVATVERWEKGLTRPQGYHLRRICEVYDLTPEMLGIHSEIMLVAIPVSERARDMAMSDFTMRLYILAVSTHRSIHEVQHELWRTLEESVKDDDITRREALCRLTWLPLLGVLAGNAISVGNGDIMNQYAAGIAACWELRKGDEHDIALAYEQMDAYLPQLLGYLQVANSTAQRKTALTLIAQCYHIKTVMGLHFESLHAAENYAHQALYYSSQASDVVLQTEVEVHLAWIYYYGKQYHQAYTTVSQAEMRLKTISVPLPQLLVSSTYSLLAVVQAVRNQKQLALSSLEQAHKHFLLSSNDDPLLAGHIDLSAMGLVADDGLIHAYLGMQDQALDSLNQVIAAPSSHMRTRNRTLNNKVLALLNSPKKEMEQAVSTWIAAMQGAVKLKSQQHWHEAMENYNTMKAIWPGERRIEELRELTIHW